MPKVLTLPPRKNSYVIPDAEIDEFVTLVPTLRNGQAAAMDSEGFETEGKALNRGRKMQNALHAKGLLTKVHAMQDEDNSLWYPAISLNVTATRRAKKSAKDTTPENGDQATPNVEQPAEQPAAPAKQTAAKK